MNGHVTEYEIIIVDDNSNDGIIETVEELKKSHPIEIIVRENERGLASAVLEGFKHAQGDIFLVMDADLSHPPEKIPELAGAIHAGSDFAIASRFIEGGSAEGFNWFRKLNAFISRMLARPLVRVTDPMSGFFCFDKNILSGSAPLNPLGWKICLELLVKAYPKKISEIPIHFKDRLHGASKLSIKEQSNYLRHLFRLYEFRYTGIMDFVKFLMVGGSGSVIDLIAVYLSCEFFEIRFRLARIIGFLLAVTSNFLLNKSITFNRPQHLPAIRQYPLFVLICAIGLSLNWVVSVNLYEHFPFFNHYYLAAAFIGTIAGFLINFAGSKYIIFK